MFIVGKTVRVVDVAVVLLGLIELEGSVLVFTVFMHTKKCFVSQPMFLHSPLSLIILPHLSLSSGSPGDQFSKSILMPSFQDHPVESVCVLLKQTLALQIRPIQTSSPTALVLKKKYQILTQKSIRLSFSNLTFLTKWYYSHIIKDKLILPCRVDAG